MLGVDDMAVQTLMETESDNEGFQNDCLKYVEIDDSETISDPDIVSQ